VGARSDRDVGRSGASTSSSFVTERCIAFLSLVVVGAFHPAFRESDASAML
jgi:hypothetical protein